jgi:hypothetical protein
MSDEIKDNAVSDTTPEVVEKTVENPVEKAEEPVLDLPDLTEPEAPKPTAITTADFAKSAEPKEQALGDVANGIIGVSAKPAAPKEKKSAPAKPKKEDTVAIHSTRNVTWNGVGKVYIGYNIVSKDAAEQWLTRSHCRPATPEEVAKEFGK